MGNERLGQFTAARESDRNRNRNRNPDARVASSLVTLLNPVLHTRFVPPHGQRAAHHPARAAYLVDQSRQRVN